MSVKPRIKYEQKTLEKPAGENKTNLLTHTHTHNFEETEIVAFKKTIINNFRGIRKYIIGKKLE